MYAFTMCACAFIVVHFASYFRSTFLHSGFHSCPLQIQQEERVQELEHTHKTISMVLYKYTCCCLSVSEERVDVCLILPQYQEWSLSVNPILWQQRSVKNNFQEKELSYFFNQVLGMLAAHFSAATIRGRHLFQWKAHRHQWQLDKVRTSDTAMTVKCYMQPLSSTVSNGKELYNMNSSSASLVMVVRIICTRVHVPRIVVAAAFWGRHLVEEIRYPINEGLRTTVG